MKERVGDEKLIIISGAVRGVLTTRRRDDSIDVTFLTFFKILVTFFTFLTFFYFPNVFFYF